MYDPKNEAKEFFGLDRDDAVAKACQFYSADEGDLTIKEVGSDKVQGLAGRFLVVALPQGVSAPERGAAPEREERSARPPRGRDRERSGGGGGSGGGRDRDRGRGRERSAGGGGGGRDRGRGGRDGGRDRDSGRDRDRGREVDGNRVPDGNRAAPAAPSAPSGPSKGEALTDLTEVGSFVQGLVERMQLGSFEISENVEGELRVLLIRGDGADNLSQQSRALDAIQLLANQAAMRSDEDAIRVVIDADGNREAREEALERLAERAADRALRAGRALGLDPMNSRDRRIIHVALRDTEDVATMSVGSGQYRQVVVVPKGAPEYEEAQRSSEQSSG